MPRPFLGIVGEVATEQEAYLEGYRVGLSWKDDYRPGGPWYPSAQSCDWMLALKDNNAAWLRGFDRGLSAAK